MIVEFYKLEDGTKPAGIFELRTIQGNNIARCLYFFTMEDKAIVTNGIIKKSDETPRSVIEIAKKYREDYERRIKDGRY